MADGNIDMDFRESTHILGEAAAGRLFALIHERLEELRERGEPWTYRDIATRLGVTEQNVARWFSEPRNMRVSSAGRLLAALEAHLRFDIEKFEDVDGGNAPAAPTAHPRHPKAEVAIEVSRATIYSDAQEVGTGVMIALEPA